MALDPAVVSEAIRLKLIDASEAGRFLREDPYAHLGDEERVEVAIASAASGAPAELPVQRVRVNGKLVPPPPFHHGKRGKPARPRKKKDPWPPPPPSSRSPTPTG